jgi:prolipoprotein diacylglyceryltransferase
MSNLLAAIGLVIGLIAVSLAAFRNNYIYSSPSPEPQKTTLKEVAGEAAKKLLEEKVLRRQPAAQQSTREDSRRLPLHPYQMVYTALGLLGFSLGILSWCRKEHIRLAGAASAVGLMAVCWEWVLIAVCIAVVILILSHLSA